MDEHHIRRFAELDAPALKRFQLALAQRRNPRGRTLAPTTIQKYLYMLLYLYRYRAEIGDGLTVDPCPGQSTGVLAGVRESHVHDVTITKEAPNYRVS